MTNSKCSVKGCGEPHYAKGLCTNHYYRLRRYGSLQTLRERGLLAEQNACSIDGCSRPATAGGRASDGPYLCQTHDAKLRRTGTLKRLVFGKEWRKRQSESKRTPLSYLDSTPDRRKGHSGFLAVNVVADIRAKADGRGKSWKLTPVEAFRMITADCHYCGTPAGWPKSRNGIDRVNNRKGYTLQNCVPACFTCNAAKGGLSLEQFKAWSERLHAKLHTSPGLILETAGLPV